MEDKKHPADCNCRECYAQYWKEEIAGKGSIENAKRWAEENPERRKEISKRAMEKFLTNKRERFNELMMKNYKENKEKWVARSKAGKQIKLAKACAACGSIENLERHHPDYSKPLLIITLCRKCHRNIHQK